ncbi:MAG: co-chaperone GroES family protein [bacterium]
MISPQAGYVLIKDKQTNKIGNFEIVSADEKESMIGEVIKCGENKKDEVCSCSTGQTIVYPKYHSSSFSWLGEEYKIVKFEDVLAIIEEGI